MSMSPARASYQRKLAALALGATTAGGAPAMPEDGPVATEYQQLLMALGQDIRQLSNIQAIDRKIAAKREMIAKYSPWIAGTLEAQTGVQDQIIVTMLIWTIDIGAWQTALDLAKYVLDHGLALPERYRRNPATLVAEEFAEAGLTSPPTIDLYWLDTAENLTAPFDMHDQARAKLAKALGLAMKAKADSFDPAAESAVAGGKPALIEAALAHFQRALGLDKSCGVKKLIEGLERDLKKVAAEGTGQ